MDYEKPDIVVGIDIGQTCSGIAYSIGPDWCEPRTLNTWPGPEGNIRAEKVATRLGYSKMDGKLVSWGFRSTWGDTNVNIREHFKLCLDAEYEDDRPGYGCEQSRQWYLDYLQCLYPEIEKFFDSCVPEWRRMRIEYNFSTPTTWRNPAMIARIESIIQQAGFASTGYQIVRMGSTEAEAAAIEACKQYKRGDVFMIVDAGGGTTDVNMIRVKAVTPNIELEPLDNVEGEPIGSTLIDFYIGQHILSRLEPIATYLGKKLEVVADEMVSSSKFQTVKHSFPDVSFDDFLLEIPGLPSGFTFHDLGIRESKLSISKAVLKGVFDMQMQRMFELLDDRLRDMQQRYPQDQVSYIILSGGLGSSPYLYQQLRDRYMMNAGFMLKNTSSLRIMKVMEPQLAVVRGLVKERTQQLGNHAKQGQEIFKTRRCRNSYGVIVKALYNPAQHVGLPTTKPDANGNMWVERLVDWFIRKGEEIDVSQGIARQYSASIAHGDQNLPRQARIVMSACPADQLPRREGEADCKQVAVVQYALTDNDMTLKNGQFWKITKKKYWKADFSFSVLLGAADLKFQILGRNGILSSNADSLQVEYMDPYEMRNGRQVPRRVDSGGPKSAPALEMKTGAVQYR